MRRLAFTALAAAACLALTPLTHAAKDDGVPTASRAGVPPAGNAALAASLGDLGFTLLRDAPAGNAVVSPVAVATVLGMIHAGALGATEREIEALFGAGATGARVMRQDLPALTRALRSEAGAATKQAARIWVDASVAGQMPAGYKRRMAQRYQADAATLGFADAEGARGQINRWTAEQTGGRVAELLPAGSIGRDTLVTLTGAVHFRSAWEKPFDTAQTEPRPFTTATGGAASVPTLLDERAIAQAEVDGHRIYSLPFAGGYDLMLVVPGEGGSIEALVKGADGAALARWRAALKDARCTFTLPKFAFGPKAGSIKNTLEGAGVKTAFSDRADLRALLGAASGKAHVNDVHHAAGIAVDEQGGEAVAAAAATVKPKSLVTRSCAVDRAFAFAVTHRASGAPLFVGRVGDPARGE
jgi:serpin B